MIFQLVFIILVAIIMMFALIIIKEENVVHLVFLVPWILLTGKKESVHWIAQTLLLDDLGIFFGFLLFFGPSFTLFFWL